MLRRTLLPLVLLVGCYARKEAVAVQSTLDAKSSLDVVERVFATAGYPPLSEDEVENGREVVHTAWRAYPPGHHADGPYQRRPVAIITPTAKGGTAIELRIDVVKCVHDGDEPRCQPLDLLFDSDKQELDILKSRLEASIKNAQQSALLSTANANVDLPSK